MTAYFRTLQRQLEQMQDATVLATLAAVLAVVTRRGLFPQTDHLHLRALVVSVDAAIKRAQAPAAPKLDDAQLELDL